MHGMQLQLFDDLPLPPRPSYLSAEVCTLTTERVAPKIIQWVCQESGTPSSQELEAIEADIFSAIECDDDAYQIAKNLEHAGWDPDAELVDLLDDVAYQRHLAHKEIVQLNWILAHGVTAKFAVGDQVSFTFKGKKETGEIIRIYPDTAQYTIHCPQHGHIKKGAGTHGHIINFEECTTA